MQRKLKEGGFLVVECLDKEFIFPHLMLKIMKENFYFPWGEMGGGKANGLST